MRQLAPKWNHNYPAVERMASNAHVMMTLEAEQLAFYHGSMREKEVERLFRPFMSKRGAYILRKSNSEENALTISVVDNRTHIYHFRVSHLPDGRYVVGGSQYFDTIQKIMDHFKKKSVPGHEDSRLTLKHPIQRKTPNTLDPLLTRPPMPAPRHEPIYNSDKHYYSAPEEKDHLEVVLEMCKEADEYFQKRCKKCSCGLYMWESELVQGWMMHRDTEGPDAQGQIFFLDTKTNNSAWNLPPEVERELKRQSPEKWENMKRLQNEASSRLRW